MIPHHAGCIEMLEQALKTLDKPKRALDCGCGHGRLHSWMSSKFRSFDAFDASAYRLELAEEKKPWNAGKFSLCNMQKWTWSKNYDVAILAWSLGYLTEKEANKFLTAAKEWV